jgi:O-antigen/teichoic acid export membrane protein
VLLGALAMLSLAGVGFVYAMRRSLFGQVRIELLLTVIAAVPYYVWQTSNSFIFAALNDLSQQNKILVTNRLFFFVVIAVAIVLVHVNLLTVAVILVVFNLLNLCADLVYLLRRCRPTLRLDFAFILALLKSGLVVHCDTVGGILIASSNVLLINYYLTATDVGLFELASQLTTVLVIFPSVAQLYVNGDIARFGANGAWTRQKRVLKKTLFVVVLSELAAYILAPTIVPLLTSPAFSSSVEIFNVLLISVTANSFAMMMGPQWTARGYFRALSAITILMGLVNLAACIYLIPREGAIGAAYASVLTYSLALAVNLGFFFVIESKFTLGSPPNKTPVSP